MSLFHITVRTSLILYFGLIAFASSVTSVSENKHFSLAGSAAFPNETFAEWMNFQNDRTKEDTDKVINTVNIYFKIKYDSWLKENLYDFGFLFFLSNKAAFDDYAYERGFLHLMLTGWRFSNTLISHYDYLPEYFDVSFENEYARVIMKPGADLIFRDDLSNRYDSPWTLHEFRLVKLSGNWIIHRVRCDDPSHNIYPRNSDFDHLAKSLIKENEEYLASERASALKSLTDPQMISRAFLRASGIAPLGYRLFNSYACRTYALDYSLIYNPLFVAYDNDCANFVSQCLWYGFGGQNEEMSIEYHDLPMIADDVDGITWWCDSSGSGIWNTRYCWTNVSHFLYMIQRNYQYNLVGLQGYRGITLSYVAIGDVIEVRAYSHVYIVSNVIDYNGNYMTDWNEIYVSAHTTDRRDQRLSSIFASPSAIRPILIMAFKDPS